MTRDTERPARRLVRALALLALLATLASLPACGGGGGGGDDNNVVNQGQAAGNWDTLVWDQDDWQ